MMTEGAPEIGSSPRASVSVVVPFAGDEAAGRELLARLSGLGLRASDELLIADNSGSGVLAGLQHGRARVVPATAEQSSYHARNVAAEASSNEWLLFVDADCVPAPTLLDDYLAERPARDVGILAGSIDPAPRAGLLPEWAATREILSQARSLERNPPAAATANLMVRRRAWEELGGFQEGIRSGGDYELCWRASDAGWRIEARPGAVVQHVHRETLRGIARQMARYGAGNAWQERRRRGMLTRPGLLAPAALAVGAAGYFGLTLRPRRALLKLVDAVAASAQGAGWLLSNGIAPDPRRCPEPRRGLVTVTDRFPVASETFITAEIDALSQRGWSVRVEALVRPDRPGLGAARGRPVHYLESTGTFARLRALAWVLARHPLRSLADARFARRFPPEERLALRAVAAVARRLAIGGEGHVHAHFAARAAVTALRAGRLARVPVSVAAHGHEVFATPRALPDKIGAAAFVAAPCEYTADHLRAAANGEGSVEVVVMGVDGERFRRALPYPGGARVVAIGRLVEKKGFADLIDAVALAGDSVATVDIAGDGPLREELGERIEAAGLGGRVRLLGTLDRAAVRDLLERADLMAVPCVVAADGDRDAMPVVAKEALAMGVPVLATAEVGLPEVVRPEWGRLVPPGDPEALAAGMVELLSRPPAERSRMGAAGREFVLSEFGLDDQAKRLEHLITGSRLGA
jgi:colanic acid/amylovoran biosynthesis glycosyltransferase